MAKKSRNGKINYVSLTVPSDGVDKSLAGAVTSLFVKEDRPEFYVRRISSDRREITLRASSPLNELPSSEGYLVSVGDR